MYIRIAGMTIQIDNVVQHKDGGLYTILMSGSSTVDKSQHVVYAHLFPFEQAVWIRPVEEFTEDRFTPISMDHAKSLMDGDREALQLQIATNKKARKG